jgi:hypothetical protein
MIGVAPGNAFRHALRTFVERRHGPVAPGVELNFPNPIETRSDLFDRESELSAIQDSLQSPARRPVVIMGERVMGKTSLLNVVVEKAMVDSQLSPLQLPHVSSRAEFVEEVLDGIAAEAHTSLHRLGLRDARGGLRLSTVAEFTRVANELSAAAAGRTFVLCLEELDSMLVNCPDDASANQILDFILHVVGRTSLPIKFVFTLTRTAPHILRSDASPFLSAARIVRLTPWTSDEARAFVERLLSDVSTVDEKAHHALFALGGGHPYLTKAVLQKLLEPGRMARPGGRITAEDIREAVEPTITSPEVDFTLENIAKVHFSDDELAVLRRLAVERDAVNETELGAAPGVAHELRQRRYLRVDPDGRYGQAFRLLGEWLKRQPFTQTDHHHPGPAPLVDPGAAGVPILTIDDGRRRVFLGPTELSLTAQEYRFLSCLGAHAGSVVDRYTIATEVWPDEVLLDGVRDDRLDALVYRLREQLGSEGSRYIETRRGRGYLVNPDRVRWVPGATR